MSRLRRDPISTLAARARADALEQMARSARVRSIAPLCRRLRVEGHPEAAAVILGVARGLVMPLRRVLGLLDAIEPIVRKLTPKERAAFDAFDELLDHARLAEGR
jgi:hypothetical protein